MYILPSKGQGYIALVVLSLFIYYFLQYLRTLNFLNALQFSALEAIFFILSGAVCLFLYRNLSGALARYFDEAYENMTSLGRVFFWHYYFLKNPRYVSLIKFVILWLGVGLTLVGVIGLVNVVTSFIQE